jgi:hypothetical protein
MTSPELPAHGGDRTHIVVTLNHDDLRTGIGTACLDVGRKHRFVTPGQRRALYLRDRGCTFPGCHHTPQRCDAHHLTSWIDGGPTDLPNLTLLCGRHHRLIHHSTWKIRMTPNGKPNFIPPDYLDPHRKPRRNTLHDNTN